MPSGWLSVRGRALARVGLGVLSLAVPPGLVDEAVGDGLAWEMRLRSLPSRLAVYFVLGLCLFSGQGYGQVLRELTAGLERALAAAGWALPSSTALTAARRRIGEKPLESLFRKLCSPLSPGRSPWSHVCGLLAVAWDGTGIDAAPSPASAAAFGKPGGGPAKARGGKAKKAPGTAARPQLRLVTLASCGTRALLDAAFGPARGKGSGERELAGKLLRSLRPGMLLLADRGFYSYGLWQAAAATGAQLLWRAQAGMRLPAAAELPDGSWLARVPDPRAARARRHKNGRRRRRGSPLGPDTAPLPGTTVRVIAFTVTATAGDGTSRTERYRLATTLLDCRAAPAAVLAAAYARRWAAETGYQELKTYLHGSRRALRARTPDLARQELWALLCVYQAIRVIICRAAAGAGTDPGRVSFTAALHAARRSVRARSRTPAAVAAVEAEILTQLNPLRPGRVYPRAAAKPISPYPSRTARPGPVSQHATYTTTLTPPHPATQNKPHQPKQPANQPPSPP